MPSASDLSRRLLARRALALVLGLALGEALLRAALLVRLHVPPPPSFPIGAPTLSRLAYAYTGGRWSSLPVGPPPVGPRLTTYDAHRGYRLAPGIRDPGTRGTGSTNRSGMRGVREYAVPKPRGVTRIVALGDSLTFGFGEPDEATWPAQLESALPGTEVANLAAPGYAHDQMYFALVDSGVALEPDIVVLAFYDNDVWRDELTYYSYEKPRFSRVDGEWRLENVPVPTPRELQLQFLAMPLLYALPRGLLELRHLHGETASDPERAWEILRRTRLAAEGAGARFLVLNLPDRPEAPPSTDGFFYDYCARTGAECVDPWPLFRAMAGTDDRAALRGHYVHSYDNHYTRAGYAVAAEALRRYLTAHETRDRGHRDEDP